MHKIIALLITPTLLFGPRTAAPDFPPPERLVTAIEITCTDVSTARNFTDPESMAQILNYLRNVEFISEESSIPPNETCYTIILTHSTGRITVYRQLGNRCLSKNNLPFRNLDPEQGAQLSAIYNNAV